MKALLSVSFGTSYGKTREKTIDVLDEKLAQAFPDRAFYTAWTSTFIIRKLHRESGEHHDTLDEAFARLEADGADDLIVATSCLLAGNEMGKIASAARLWGSRPCRTLRVARPLLSSEADCHELARILRDEYAVPVGDDALLFMGHGSPHGGNQVYAQVQDALRQLACPKYFVATVEGSPTFDDVLPALLSCGAQRICLAPLMIVAGDHATNDLAGKEEDSWKSLLERRGLATHTILRGLGEFAGVHEMVCQRALSAPELPCEKADGALGD